MPKKKIVIIPPTKRPDGSLLNENKKYRVAAYARVSTDKEDQLNSLETQMDFFNEYIKSNPNWELVKVYADEGISGLSRKKRKNFNQMVEDAKNGLIDIILSKSISRFARNVVDTLTVTRELKEKNVYVYFQKENLNTRDPNGEFMLNFMAGFAEEESKSISNNIKWSKKRIIKEGKVSLAYCNFLGYKRGEHKYEMVIDRKQAVIVKLIYRMYLTGSSTVRIAQELEKKGIPSPMSKNTWQTSTISSILTNEKYCGDAILQKTFTTDIFTKKEKINDNIMDKVYVYNDHPAIIKRETFNEVQEQVPIRRKLNSNMYVFSCKLLCMECNNYYRMRNWYHEYYDEPVMQWICNKKYEDIRCKNIVLFNDELMYALSQIFVQVKEKYDFVFKDLKEIVFKNLDSKKQTFIKKSLQNKELSKDDEMMDVFYRVVIKRIDVYSERVLAFNLIDGTVIPYKMPKWYIKYKRPYEGKRPINNKDSQS